MLVIHPIIMGTIYMICESNDNNNQSEDASNRRANLKDIQSVMIIIITI